MKGRVGNAISLSNGEEFPLFQINDLIAKDTKRILSSEVVFVNGAVVCNVEGLNGINPRCPFRKRTLFNFSK